MAGNAIVLLLCFIYIGIFTLYVGICENTSMPALNYNGQSTFVDSSLLSNVNTTNITFQKLNIVNLRGTWSIVPNRGLMVNTMENTNWFGNPNLLASCQVESDRTFNSSFFNNFTITGNFANSDEYIKFEIFNVPGNIFTYTLTDYVTITNYNQVFLDTAYTGAIGNKADTMTYIGTVPNINNLNLSINVQLQSDTATAILNPIINVYANNQLIYSGPDNNFMLYIGPNVPTNMVSPLVLVSNSYSIAVNYIQSISYGTLSDQPNENILVYLWNWAGKVFQIAFFSIPGNICPVDWQFILSGAYDACIIYIIIGLMWKGE